MAPSRRALYRRNARVMILSSVALKMGLEVLSLCMALLAAWRFPPRVALTCMCSLSSASVLAQSLGCGGARPRTPHVLAWCAWGLGAVVGALVVLEGLTGGTFRIAGAWPAVLLFPVQLAIAVCIGMSDTTRRNTIKEVAGSNRRRAAQLDLCVRVCYEVAGTVGAFVATPLIASFGAAYGLVPVPFLLGLAGLGYQLLQPRPLGVKGDTSLDDSRHSNASCDVSNHGPSGFEEAKLEGPTVLVAPRLCIYEVGGLASSTSTCSFHSVRFDLEQPQASVDSHTHDLNNSTLEEAREVLEGALGRSKAMWEYFRAIRVGARIVLSRRKFAWLLMGYTLPLVVHKLMEGVLFPAFAILTLRQGAYVGILQGGSNLGEVVALLLVHWLGHEGVVATPLPFVRWDALALALLWTLAKPPATNALTCALAMMGFMWLVSGGWAAADVSLLAYIESQMGLDFEDTVDGVSPLKAVIAFLYSAYVLLYAPIAIGIGLLLDHYANLGEPETGLWWVCVLLSGCGALILSSTFFPPGSWAINPRRPDITFAWEQGLSRTRNSSSTRRVQDTAAKVEDGRAW